MLEQACSSLENSTLQRSDQHVLLCTTRKLLGIYIYIYLKRALRKKLTVESGAAVSSIAWPSSHDNDNCKKGEKKERDMSCHCPSYFLNLASVNGNHVSD